MTKKSKLDGNYMVLEDGSRYDVGGSLDLEGTQIAALPDNLTVGGSLYLRGTQIAALPDNLTVGGSLDLEGTQIAALPDNLTVGGSLYLRGTQIAALPDNLTVGEWLDLRRPTRPLSWREGKYVQVDGILSEVIHWRGNVIKTKHLTKNEPGYIVTDGQGRWAHGETLKEARADLIYKLSDRDKSDYEGLGPDHVFTFPEAIEAYRVITGACATGVKHFVSGHEVKESYTVREIVDLTQGQYGHDDFKAFFEAAV